LFSQAQIQDDVDPMIHFESGRAVVTETGLVNIYAVAESSIGQKACRSSIVGGSSGPSTVPSSGASSFASSTVVSSGSSTVPSSSGLSDVLTRPVKTRHKQGKKTKSPYAELRSKEVSESILFLEAKNIREKEKHCYEIGNKQILLSTK